MERGGNLTPTPPPLVVVVVVFFSAHLSLRWDVLRVN